ncbi:Alpha1,3-fucosyltransferase-like proteinue [Aphelenchoides besseyi]|nr:Alpha1,3-fucosyltransferase-like proteinue [Aphelenchoides besseyi]
MRLIFCFIAILFVFLLWPRRKRAEKSRLKKTRPIVFFATTFIDEDASRVFVPDRTCPFNCTFTSDPDYASLSDVRVFHPTEFHGFFPEDNPNAVNVHVFFESPVQLPDNALKRNDYFNVTVSYRSTATVYVPYGEFVPNGNATQRQVTTKRKKVLASISNCDLVTSGRAAYLKELEKHIEVTKVGKCYSNRVDSLDQLVDDHYFFLAFENSICPEYTSEKYWRLRNFIVPVVLSRGVLNSHNILNGTFIAASDFESPLELAKYLEFLIANKSEYEKYFEWTQKLKPKKPAPGVYEIDYVKLACVFCRLASQRPKLHAVNIESYWNKSECGLSELEMSNLVTSTMRRRQSGNTDF